MQLVVGKSLVLGAGKVGRGNGKGEQRKKRQNLRILKNVLKRMLAEHG